MVLEVCVVPRRLLKLSLHDMSRARSVNTEKAAPETGINSEGSTQDPTQVNTAPSSVIGKRETVSWRKAADCVRLTGAQAAAVAEARTTVGARLTECALLPLAGTSAHA